MQQVKVGEFKNVIESAFSLARDKGQYVPLMFWGPPGVGKSASVKQATEELGIGLIDLRLSLFNPVDLRGLPTVDREAKKAVWLSPEFLPDPSVHGEQGILFLDEINLAPQSVMSAAYQLILDRALGGYKVPDGWIIVAAGNRVDDNPNVTKMPAPLANRLIHFEIPNPDPDEWRTWAMRHGLAEEVVSFIGKFPNKLFVLPKNNEKSWSSPRSWAHASMLYSIGQRIDGAVGNASAGEFYAYLDVYKDMPDVDKIMKGEETKVPKNKDVLWALIIAMVYRAKPEYLDNVFAYISQLDKEFEVLAILSIAEKSDELRAAVVNNKKWSDWVKANQPFIDSVSR